MSLLIPAAVNYPSPLPVVPARYGNEPSEGRKFVPVEIDWSTMGGANNAVSFSLYQNAAQILSQICAFSVDNSECGSDIQIIFTDSGQTYTVPAYEPASVFPVFTNQINFYVIAEGEVTNDVTRFAILNFNPMPSSITPTEHQNVASLASGAFDGASTYQLIANTVTGTLESLLVNVSGLAGGASFGYGISIQDGTGAVIASGTVNASSGQAFNVNPIELGMFNVRFKQGIKVILSGGPGSEGTISVNAYYRIP